MLWCVTFIVNSNSGKKFNQLWSDSQLFDDVTIISLTVRITLSANSFAWCWYCEKKTCSISNFSDFSFIDFPSNTLPLSDIIDFGFPYRYIHLFFRGPVILLSSYLVKRAKFTSLLNRSIIIKTYLYFDLFSSKYDTFIIICPRGPNSWLDSNISVVRHVYVFLFTQNAHLAISWVINLCIPGHWNISSINSIYVT